MKKLICKTVAWALSIWIVATITAAMGVVGITEWATGEEVGELMI